MLDRRYQKRISHYIEKCEKTALANLSELDIDGWFDYWHMHPDHKFRGNRVRPLIARLTYKLLQAAERRIEARSKPIQAWALLHENTGNTAVYLHSPNPNGTPFPYDFEGVEWGVTEPDEVRSILRQSHELGRCTFEDETIYVIRKRS
jgi:hypothetical protein